MSSVTFKTTSSSSSSTSPIVSASFESKALDQLNEEGLYEFYKANNEIPSSFTERTDVKYVNEVKKSIGFIHFIWMGNPMKKLHTDTIKTWKVKYPNKQIIIWVDQNALKHDELRTFAKDNNIILIDLDKVFTEGNSFGLKKYINEEKELVPPNWGTASDMYRYLIMYYFAGIYSDTDSPIRSELRYYNEGWDDPIDFTNDFAFRGSPNLGPNYNDRIMTKNLREIFWYGLLQEIGKRYQIGYEPSKWFCMNYGTKKNRFFYALLRTGLGILEEQLKNLDKSKIQFIKCSTLESEFSWRSKLDNDKFIELAKEKNIINRIAKHIIFNARYKKSLNLCKFNNITCFINKKINMVNEIKNEIENMNKNDAKILKIEKIFSNSYEDYKSMKEFLIDKLPKENLLLEDNLLDTLKKVIKENNFDMFRDFLTNEKVSHSDLKKSFLFLFKKFPSISEKISMFNEIIDKLPNQDLADVLSCINREFKTSFLNIAVKENKVEIITKILNKLSDEDLIGVLQLNKIKSESLDNQDYSQDVLRRILIYTLTCQIYDTSKSDDPEDTFLHKIINFDHIKLVEKIIDILSKQDLIKVLLCKNGVFETPLDLILRIVVEKNNKEILIKILNKLFPEKANEIEKKIGNNILDLANEINEQIVKLSENTSL